MTEENKRPPRLSKSEEDMMWRLGAAEINIANLFRRLETMTRTLQKLDEAYYQAFPDRIDKDVRFEDQIEALKKASTKPNAPRRLDQLNALRKKAAVRNPDTSRKQS